MKYHGKDLDLETLELGLVSFLTKDANITHSIQDSKKFKFRPRGKSVVEFVKDLFKNESTELIIACGRKNKIISVT